jgi:RNA polymerase primary sigma factor
MMDDDLSVGIAAGAYSAIAHLVELGRRKSYITDDDILAFIPEAEQDSDQLDDIFAALFHAGIDYLDNEAISGAEERLDSSDENDRLEDDDLSRVHIDDGLSLYMKEIGRIPLLTQGEEVELARRIERGRSAREELVSGKASSIRREQLRNLIEIGWNAQKHLVVANARLVISVAKQYRNRGVPLQDLIQEGNIGLMRATSKFDYRLGFKFSTYATWWIRQAVNRAISNQARTIRVPVHIHDQIIRFFRARQQLIQRLGRDPTVEELASVLGDSTTRIESLIQVARLPLSLEAPTNHEGDVALEDFVEDEEAPTPADLASLILLQEHLEEVFQSLSPREVRVLKLRYGLLDGKEYTLKEIGAKLGVSRERVRQVQARAMERLRQPTIRRKLQAYLITE